MANLPVADTPGNTEGTSARSRYSWRRLVV